MSLQHKLQAWSIILKWLHHKCSTNCRMQFRN